MAIISQITSAIESVGRVKLLGVEPGKSANRTVMTFAGEPDDVFEAAFIAVKKASELIDMSKHKGVHPRFGATDVLPLVPLTGITMDETVAYARKLAGRIGEELDIPVYCYGNAAFYDNRKDLALVRKGEYEGLAAKISNPEWKPDFGPAVLNVKTGAIAVGARDFLVAYNINLNTPNVSEAKAIASLIREKGSLKRKGNKPTGKIIEDKKGNPVYEPGTLKCVKAIGWFIEEYGIAQISMNLTNLSVTPVHVAFEEVCRKAEELGLEVTGSELVGLIPLKYLLDAGKYFKDKFKGSTISSEAALIAIAIEALGLNDISPFNPEDKIIEYKLQG